MLADGLGLAVEDGADAIIDIATLTGAVRGRPRPGDRRRDGQRRRRGSGRCGRAADRADEPVWPLPLPARYRSQLDSDVADLKNIGSDYGGALAAGLFLKEFVRRRAVGPPRHRRADEGRPRRRVAIEGGHRVRRAHHPRGAGPLHPAALDPLLVLLLQRGGQPAELAVAQRREAAAHPHAVAVRLRQPELHAALERAGEGAVAPRRGAEARGRRPSPGGRARSRRGGRRRRRPAGAAATWPTDRARRARIARRRVTGGRGPPHRRRDRAREGR